MGQELGQVFLLSWEHAKKVFSKQFFVFLIFSIQELFRWASGKREFDTFRNSVVIELLSILFYNMEIEVFKKLMFLNLHL